MTYWGYDLYSSLYDSYKYSEECIVIPSAVEYDGKRYVVTEIGEYAFYTCNITSITIPESVTTIGDCAFRSCSSLTSISIPKNVTTIGGEVFSGCTNLTSVHISNGVANIEGEMFRNCTNLASIIIPESVTRIGNAAFYGCSNLTSITFSEGLKEIGEMAFRDCNKLTSLTFPKGLSSIGLAAFQGCNAITSITFSEGNYNLSLDTGAFGTCSELMEIISLNARPPHIDAKYTFLQVPKNNCIVRVPAESMRAYQSAEGWKEFLNIVPYNPANQNILYEGNSIATK